MKRAIIPNVSDDEKTKIALDLGEFLRRLLDENPGAERFIITCLIFQAELLRAQIDNHTERDNDR